MRGWDFIIAEMMLDLAALNRAEMLCWDSWGFVDNLDSLSEDDKVFLDTVAEATLDNQRFEAWQTLFEHEHLRIPTVIHSFTPAEAPDKLPVTVQLNL